MTAPSRRAPGPRTLRGMGHTRFDLWAPVLVGLGVLACSDTSASADDEGSGGGTGGGPPAGPTYRADVAPILAARCVGCHEEGGIAPFTLTTYGDVAPLAEAIRSVTESRQMPPFLPDNSGSCATYVDAPWLGDGELATLAAWADAGAPEGDPGTPLPELPEPTSLLAETTHELSLVEPYTPDASLLDDYRCFVVAGDVPGDRETFIEAYEVVPGDKRVVHHVIAYQPTSDAAVAAIRDLDAAADGPGYPCFGGAGGSAAMLMNWAPGAGIVRHPAGTGVALAPGRPVVVQIHYNTANGSFPDRSRFRLRLADAVARPLRPWFFTDGQLDLPPGEERLVKEIAIPYGTFRGLLGGAAAPGPTEVLGVRAHMHRLGAAMHIEVERAGSGERACLADIPRYDFGWQRSYFLTTPVALQPEDTLRLRCEYDTRSVTTKTTWGEGTTDEMCLATFYTAPRSP